jgi:DnaJ-class molecular chaperone
MLKVVYCHNCNGTGSKETIDDCEVCKGVGTYRVISESTIKKNNLLNIPNLAEPRAERNRLYCKHDK